MANKRFPSHTEIYRDFHLIHSDVLAVIIDHLDDKLRMEVKKIMTKYDFESAYEFEVRNWDIVIDVSFKRSKYLKIKPIPLKLFLEYKSSINEWGKQFDAYIRQMKKRIYMRSALEKRIKHHFLISFDPEFEAFKEAAKTCGFTIIVLPKSILEKIKVA